jgi:hypothetical protein
MWIWKAEYESRNFSFAAYGSSKKHALDTLYIGLDVHKAQCKLEQDWFSKDDISCEKYGIGIAYRDGLKIYSDEHEAKND